MNSCVAAYYPCLVQLMRCFAYFTTEIDTTCYYYLLVARQRKTALLWGIRNGTLPSAI